MDRPEPLHGGATRWQLRGPDGVPRYVLELRPPRTSRLPRVGLHEPFAAVAGVEDGRPDGQVERRGDAPTGAPPPGRTCSTARRSQVALDALRSQRLDLGASGRAAWPDDVEGHVRALGALAQAPPQRTTPGPSRWAIRATARRGSETGPNCTRSAGALGERGGTIPLEL